MSRGLQIWVERSALTVVLGIETLPRHRQVRKRLHGQFTALKAQYGVCNLCDKCKAVSYLWESAWHALSQVMTNYM